MNPLDEFKDVDGSFKQEHKYRNSNVEATSNFSNFFADRLGIGISSARAQNQLNRDFQERMANTQWQRGTEDMKKAGINPLAAFTSAAGAVPAGSSGTSGQETGIISNIIGSSARLLGDLANAKATNMRTDLYRNNLKNLIVSSAKFIK